MKEKGLFISMGIVHTLHKLLDTGLSAARIIKYRSAYRYSLQKIKAEDLCIIGNGPSLKRTLINTAFWDFAQGKDIFGVNTLVFSDEYSKLTPKYYILLDPEFWEATASEESCRMREDLFAALKEKTQWNMIFFIPAVARKSNFISGASLGPNIQVQYFNNAYFKGLDPIGFPLYKHGYCMPLPQNVLIGALYLGLNMGYQRLYLVGADMSLHENVVLNKQNVVCGKVIRFYEEEDEKTEVTELVPFLKQGADPFWSMQELFQAFADTFRTFDELERYARYLGVRIYNASDSTYIDAFERCELAVNNSAAE